MKEVLEYAIIESESRESFEVEVNKKIKEGWQPYGSLCVMYPYPNVRNLIQVMVKYGE